MKTKEIILIEHLPEWTFFESSENFEELMEAMKKAMQEYAEQKEVSDEEIEAKAFHPKTANDVKQSYLDAKRKYFIKGAKWMRYKLKQQL